MVTSRGVSDFKPVLRNQGDALPGIDATPKPVLLPAGGEVRVVRIPKRQSHGQPHILRLRAAVVRAGHHLGQRSPRCLSRCIDGHNPCHRDRNGGWPQRWESVTRNILHISGFMVGKPSFGNIRRRDIRGTVRVNQCQVTAGRQQDKIGDAHGVENGLEG